MKNKNLLSYSLLVSELLSLVVAIFVWISQYYSLVGLLTKSRIHLSFQILLASLAIFGIYRLLKIKKVSTKMRKQAGNQKLALSKRVEFLLLFLMSNALFHSLFLTFSPGRYIPSMVERTLYITTLLLQFLLIANLVNSRERNNKEVAKLDHRFSIVGAVIGILLYIIYYQYMV